MEDEDTRQMAPSQGVYNDGFIRSFDYSTFVRSSEQSRPLSQRSDSSAHINNVSRHPSTPAPSQPESLHSDTDPQYFEPYNPTDHKTPGGSEDGILSGRGSKRPAALTPNKDAKKSRVDKKAEDVENLLSNPKSGVYKPDFNLKSVLLHETTSRLLPQGSASFSQLSPQELNSAIASFKEDGRGGRHDPEWARQALEASVRRAAGEFDDYQASKFQETWAEDISELSESDDDDDDPAENQDSSLDRPPSSFNHSRQHDDDDDVAPGGSSYESINVASHLSSNGIATKSGNEGYSSTGPSANRGASQDVESETVDLLPPAPKWQIISITADEKLDTLFRPCPFVSQPVIRVGDVLRLKDTNLPKDVVIVAYHSLGSRMKRLKPSTKIGYLEIAIPPRGFAISEPHLRKDVIFPSDTLHGWITGLAQVFQAIRSVEPDIRTSKEWSWENYEVYRDNNLLGTVLDLRQAWHFAKNEYDFKCQLKFEGGRQRRLHRSQQDDGYMLFPNSGFYRKIRAADAGLQNGWIIIGLGNRLSKLLESCADTGFTIFMYDFRILINDGIPVPKCVTLQEIYERGPAAFTTPFTREVAASAGWTKGHAHIGPLGLGKGWKGSQWSKGRARPGTPVERQTQNLHREWLDLQKIKNEQCPGGQRWTPREIAAVANFHQTEIVGKIRHTPLPKTKLSAHIGVMPAQLNFEEEGCGSSDTKMYTNRKNGTRTTLVQASPRHTATGSQAALSEVQQPQRYVSPFAAASGKSRASYVDLSSLPPGDARVAITELFLRDPRRSSSVRFDPKLDGRAPLYTDQESIFSSGHANSGHYCHISSSVGSSRHQPASLYNRVYHAQVPAYSLHVPAAPDGLIDLEAENYPWSEPYYLAENGQLVRTKVREFNGPKIKLQPRFWDKALEAPACTNAFQVRYPVNDLGEAVQRWPYNNVDNPYSVYPEIPPEYLLPMERPQEQQKARPYRSEVLVNGYEVFSFGDGVAVAVAAPPPPFRSAFGNFDGSCDERVASPTNTFASSDSEVNSTASASFISSNVEIKAEPTAVKAEFSNPAFIKSESQGQGDLLTTYPQPQASTTITTSTKAQSARTCTTSDSNPIKTEDSRVFLPAAEYPKLSGIIPFIKRENLAPSRFRTPTEMARHKISRASATGSPAACSGSTDPYVAGQASAPSVSVGRASERYPAPPSCTPSGMSFSAGSASARYPAPQPASPTAGTCYAPRSSAQTRPAAPQTPPTNDSHRTPFGMYGTVSPLNLRPHNEQPSQQIRFQNPDPQLWNSETAGFLPDSTFHDSSQYTSPYRVGRSPGSSLPAGAYHAVAAWTLHQKNSRASDNDSNSVSSQGPFDLLNDPYPKIGHPGTTSNYNGLTPPPAGQAAVTLAQLVSGQAPSYRPPNGPGPYYTYPAASQTRGNQMKQEVNAAQSRPCMYTTSRTNQAQQNAVNPTNIENMSFTIPIQAPAFVNHNITPVTGTDDLSSAQNPPLELKSSDAIYYDRNRQPQGIRIRQFTTNEPSSTNSIYPDPNGYLSLPHFPNIMYPISDTPLPLAVATAPVNTDVSVIRKKRKFEYILDNDDYVFEGEESEPDVPRPSQRK